MEQKRTLNAHSRSKFWAQIERLYKKCDKLGVPRPVIETGPNYTKKIPTGEVSEASWPYISYYVADLFDITISYDPIKLAGWELVARVDHGAAEVKQYDIQAKYEFNFVEAVRTNRCEHCGNTRLKRSFIVLNGGEFKQVGHACLKDFTGVSPDKYFSLFKAYNDVFDGMDEPGSGGGGGGYGKTPNPARELAQVITLAMQVIKADAGYIKPEYEMVSRGYGRNAQEDKVRKNSGAATGDKVREVMAIRGRIGWSADFPERIEQPVMYEVQTNRLKQYKYFNQDPIDQTAVESFHAWLAAMKPKTDFDQKISELAGTTMVLHADIPFVCYVVSAWLKSQEEPEFITGHFFTDGQRVELELMEKHVSSFDTDFGRMWICTYADRGGRQFKYKGSAPADISKTEFTSVKATVKHSTYRDVAQTMIQRIKISSPSKATA